MTTETRTPMIPRLLCGVFAVAMAGPCFGQPPAKASRTKSRTVARQGSSSTTANSSRPVMKATKSAGYRSDGLSYGNVDHSGSSGYCGYGPGSQYFVGNGGLRLDLSNGIGLWDPCNAWGPHYGCW